MEVKNMKEVSMTVVRRMPRYYHQICLLQKEGVQRISSGLLAERMGLTASQIRQDFNCFGGFGQQGYGYQVENLRRELEKILCLDKGRSAILVGVGHLGSAILRNFEFSASGVQVVGAFDPDLTLVDRKIGGVTVQSLDMMEEFIRRNDVDIAVLTVPGEAAVESARKLADWGIKGIWNFTGVELELEDRIPVEEVEFSQSLMVLNYRMK